jgi:hypothetical protein
MADENVVPEENKSSGEEETLDQTDGLDDDDGSWGISLRHGTLSKKLRALEYFTANGLHQAFHVLDPKKTGKVIKTQLQILCINLCTVTNVPFSPDNIMKYKEKEKELNFQEFLCYIASQILVKSK